MRISDWSSDVCSSDLGAAGGVLRPRPARFGNRAHECEPALYRDQHRDLAAVPDRRGDDLCRSEEHTSELQSLMRISYAVFCLTKKKQTSIAIRYTITK